ncbi:hypothetical protein [Methylobacter marinus]|uniref:hypothetical protein n=1 Tax=Methylobacter marinus TaxID=34058 RepID=UPI000363D479|nr:hypothetical protein [Methylobacter marinus]
MTAIELQYDSPIKSDLDLMFVDVIDRDMNTLREETFSPMNPLLTIPVVPGNYLVRVRRSTGKNFSIPISVELNQICHVPLRPPGEPSPHEWLHLQHALELLPKMQQRGSMIFKAPLRKQTLWARLWVYTDPNTRMWAEYPWAELHSEADESFINLSFLGQSQTLSIIQCGGETVPWRAVALPPVPERLEIVFSPSQLDAELSGGMNLVVSRQDPDTELLLKALSSVGPNSSEQMLEYLMEAKTPLSESLFSGKFEDPVTAVIVGYFLLRNDAFDCIHSWADNLASTFEWFPDGAIIHAWQLLADPNHRSPQRSRERLLEAVRRGLPVYTEGLRLLRDGLTYFARLHDWQGQQPFAGEEDVDVQSALITIQPYLAAADWNQPQTTFFGRTPMAPSLKPVKGIPVTHEELFIFRLSLKDF